MIYQYRCTSCRHEFEVYKRVADIEVCEPCPSCTSELTIRIITGKHHFIGAGSWNFKPAYDPVFGKVISSQAERKRIAKERGWEEIGNENIDKIHKENEDKNQRIRDDNWSKA